MQRRARVEHFLRKIGLDPSRSTSRNPLEQPWRAVAQVKDLRYQAAREETLALTEEIEQVEREIDERVKELYGP